MLATRFCRVQNGCTCTPGTHVGPRFPLRRLRLGMIASPCPRIRMAWKSDATSRRITISWPRKLARSSRFLPFVDKASFQVYLPERRVGIGDATASCCLGKPLGRRNVSSKQRDATVCAARDYDKLPRRGIAKFGVGCRGAGSRYNADWFLCPFADVDGERVAAGLGQKRFPKNISAEPC